MNVKTYFPNHPLLRKHIAFYYFLKTDEQDFNRKYYAFPALMTPLNIHQNISSAITDDAINISGNQDQNNVLIVQGMRKRPLLIELAGKLDKVTILFKPLGLNQFIKRSFLQVAPDHSQVFDEWDSEPDFNHFLETFYKVSDLEQRVAILESFLLSVYKPLQQDLRFEEAITALTDFSNEISVEEIVKKSNMHIRTFDRMFKTHLGISPSAFRKTARFRHSLDNKLISHELKRLVDIGYESNFYDQAYFINVYKQITGANPKSFFKNISQLAGSKLVFQYLK